MAQKTSEIHELDEDELISYFLQGTSRTFALAIPLLNTDRRRQIGISYLLFRVADSVEDASGTDVERKLLLLTALRCCFSTPKFDQSIIDHHHLETSPIALNGLWPDQSPTGELLQAFPKLMAILDTLPSQVSQVIAKALTSTLTGMSAFMKSSQVATHQIHIVTLDELQLYCYVVAGIVGEMLTDIFVYHHPVPTSAHQELRRLSVGFGEFLQLINILNDSGTDAASGRLFVPSETPRERICALALAGRESALAYIRILESNDFPYDIVHFCNFIYMLADVSLQKLLGGGPNSRLTRTEVLQILSRVKSESSFLPA